MHYFIDGYNLMFRVLHAGDDLQKQRESVISDLNEKVQTLNLDVTIVFDAHYQLGEGSRLLYDTMEICFTNEGETADEYILRRVKVSSNPRQETVVTSDNRLAWAARRLLAKTESVKEFLSWLQRRYKNRLKKSREEGESPLARQLSKFRIHSEEHTSEEESPPKPKKTVEENFDYYLYQFEKRFRESEANKEKKKEKPASKKHTSRSPKKRKIPKSQQSEETDMQRWLRLFEEREKENEK